MRVSTTNKIISFSVLISWHAFFGLALAAKDSTDIPLRLVSGH